MRELKSNIKGWDKLPPHVRESFEEAFQNNPVAMRLRRNALLMESQRNYVAAMKALQTLDQARVSAQQRLMEEQGYAEEKVTLLEMGLSHEQLDKINTLTIALYMACDMLEFFALDINSILKKKDPTAHFEMFDPILKIGKQAKENLAYLSRNTSMYDDEFFNDSSDDMRKLLLNKAKKVYLHYAKVVEKKENQNNN
jgi:hypothetical protein